MQLDGARPDPVRLPGAGQHHDFPCRRAQQEAREERRRDRYGEGQCRDLKPAKVGPHGPSWLKYTSSTFSLSGPT